MLGLQPGYQNATIYLAELVQVFMAYLRSLNRKKKTKLMASTIEQLSLQETPRLCVFFLQSLSNMATMSELRRAKSLCSDRLII